MAVTSILSNVLFALAVIVATCISMVFKFYFWDYVIRPRWFVRYIKGPKSTNFTRGHIPKMMDDEPGKIAGEWFGEYGHIFAMDGALGTIRLCIDDKVALHHILVSDPYKFPKPELLRKILGTLLGEGILFAEGDTHRRMRKIMNPSFGAPHMKSLYPLFINKALQLRDKILEVVSDASTPEVPEVRVDMYAYAGRATLDVISSAGFGYETNAIEQGNANELASSMNELFNNSKRQNTSALLLRVFPWLGYVIRRKKTHAELTQERAMSTMHRIGNQLVQEKKAAVHALNGTSNVSVEKGGEGKTDMSGVGVGRDLLSVLIKANMAADLKPSQTMTDKEVMDQITTFLLAGNDTTANGISWALYGLCSSPHSQTHLRTEILSLNEESPSYETLNSLPYLDAVIRETLRRFSPASGTTRTASEDCVIPLAKPIMGKDGIARSELHVAKNTMLYISMAHQNLDTATWGPDAMVFNPDRWLNSEKLPEGVMELPSVAFPSFLAGPRACIGWRFSFVEMKTILYSLVRVMKFELAVPVDDIEGRSLVVMRPRVKSRREESWQLPVNVSLVDA